MMPAALDSNCGLWVGASPHVVTIDEIENDEGGGGGEEEEGEGGGEEGGGGEEEEEEEEKKKEKKEKEEKEKEKKKKTTTTRRREDEEDRCSGNRILCVFLCGSLVLTASPLGLVSLASLVNIRNRPLRG